MNQLNEWPSYLEIAISIACYIVAFMILNSEIVYDDDDFGI